MKNERSLSGVLEKMSEVLSEALKMNGNLQTVYCGAEIGAEQEPNRSRTGAKQEPIKTHKLQTLP